MIEEAELKMDVREDIMPAISAANIRPFRPGAQGNGFPFMNLAFCKYI